MPLWKRIGKHMDALPLIVLGPCALFYLLYRYLHDPLEAGKAHIEQRKIIRTGFDLHNRRPPNVSYRFLQNSLPTLSNVLISTERYAYDYVQFLKPKPKHN